MVVDDMRFAVCKRPGHTPFVMRVFGHGNNIDTTFGCYRLEKNGWKAYSLNNPVRVLSVHDTMEEARNHV